MSSPAAIQGGRAGPSVRTISDFKPLATNGLFYFYLFFVVTHFLRASARIPGVGALRPTLLMVVGLAVALFLKREEMAGKLSVETNRRLLFFALWVFLSLPFVEWPGSVLRNNLEEWIRAATFFYFTVLIVDSFERLRLFVAVFTATQVFRVLEPLYLHQITGYWGSSTFIGGGEFMDRLGGGPYDTINPNGLGFVIVSIVPFLYFLWLGSRRASVIGKLICLAIIGAALYALLLTSSRSGFLALLVVVAAIFIKSRRKAVFLAIVIAAGGFTYANMTDLQKDRYLSIVSSDTRSGSTAEGRVEGIEHEFELAMRNPLFGHGLGTSGEAKYHYFGRYQVAHNLYTELIIDCGIPGLALFFGFIWSALRAVRALGRSVMAASALTEEQKSYLVALSDAVQVWAAMCLFISLAYYGVIEWHWYLMAGICVSAARLASSPHLAGADEKA